MLGPALLAAAFSTTPTVCTYTWNNANVVAIGATTAGDHTPTGQACYGGLLLPARTMVLDAYVVVTGSAAGPAAVSVALGRTSAAYIDYVVASDAKAAAPVTYGDAEAEQGTNLSGGKSDIPSLTTTTQLSLHFISTGANLSTVTGSAGTVILTLVTLPPVFASDALVLTSPKPFDLFRRSGPITVAGTNYSGGACTIEARIAGGSWSTVQASVANAGAFSGTITAPAVCTDRTLVEARCTTNLLASREIPGISVGLRVAPWGQSNASGFVASNQAFTGKRRGSLVTNCGERGNLTDPWDRACSGDDAATRDTAGATGAKGSVWPLVAATLADATNCPVEMVAGGTLGGTDIAYWAPGGAAYIAANARWAAGGGIDIAVGWQGEANALAQTSQVAYNAALDTLANTIFSDRGAKLVMIKLQNSSGIPDADEARIVAAIAEACADNANVPVCVDLTDQASDDSYHLTTDAKAAIAGARIAAGLQTGLGL